MAGDLYSFCYLTRSNHMKTYNITAAAMTLAAARAMRELKSIAWHQGRGRGIFESATALRRLHSISPSTLRSSNEQRRTWNAGVQNSKMVHRNESDEISIEFLC